MRRGSTAVACSLAELAESAAQVGCAVDDLMVEAFPPNRVDQRLGMTVLSGRARPDWMIAYSQGSWSQNCVPRRGERLEHRGVDGLHLEDDGEKAMLEVR